MVKFRNIRVKMKGGKTRIQRAMVMASGKLKFVKNVAHSRSSLRGYAKSAMKKARHSKRRNTNMVRRKKHYSSKSLTKGVEKIARGVGAAAPFGIAYIKRGDSGGGTMGFLNELGVRLTGFDFQRGGWNAIRLVEGYGPALAVEAGIRGRSLLRRLLRSF